MDDHPMIAAIERQIEQNREEHIWLKEQLRQARQRYASRPAPRLTPTKSESIKSPLPVRLAKRRAFVRKEGGFSDTAERIMKMHGGWTIDQLVAFGSPQVQTDSEPSRVAEHLKEEIKKKIKRGLATRTLEGKIFWVK